MAKKDTDYPERPLKEALAKPQDIAKVEDRPEKDQIENYHKDHPTMGRAKWHNPDAEKSSES